MSMQQHDDAPWYRHRWPWILIAIPGSSVIFGFTMLGLALGSNNALVVDDYYREGKTINQRIARDARAAELEVSARLDIERAIDGERIVLALRESTLAGRAPEAMAAAIRVRWVHVTRAERDGERILMLGADGRYTAPVEDFPRSGRFRLHVEPIGEGWRLVSGVHALDVSLPITIEPARRALSAGDAVVPSP